MDGVWLIPGIQFGKELDLSEMEVETTQLPLLLLLCCCFVSMSCSYLLIV